MGVLLLFCYIICYFYFISSPFLFVIGDDRVTCYIGTDDDTGDAADTQWQREGLLGDFELGNYLCFLLSLLDFGIVIILLLLLYEHDALMNVLNCPAFGNNKNHDIWISTLIYFI